MITKAQISLIHVAKARLGLSDEDYRAALLNHGGVASSRALTAAGFDALMRHFAACGFQSDAVARAFGQRAGMASPAQVRRIRAEWATFTSGEGTDATLGKWLDGRFKVSALRFLTMAQATKAIGALVSMNQRRGQKAAPVAS